VHRGGAAVARDATGIVLEDVHEELVVGDV
jgi:hypothetical protein